VPMLVYGKRGYFNVRQAPTGRVTVVNRASRCRSMRKLRYFKVKVDRPGKPIKAVLYGATLVFMPTTRPRHTITETPPVQEALDELRAKLNGERVDLAELVILGAHAKARRLPNNTEKALEARRRLAEWIRNGNPGMVDMAAAKEVKHLGLIAKYDE
jgi:hypothetical protein